MKIRFVEDRVVRAGDKIVERFKAGQVVELSDASARHWLSRNAAEIFMGGKKAAAEAEADKEPQPAGDGGEEHPVIAGLKAQKAAPKNPKKRHF